MEILSKYNYSICYADLQPDGHVMYFFIPENEQSFRETKSRSKRTSLSHTIIFKNKFVKSRHLSEVNLKAQEIFLKGKDSV